MIHYLKLLPKYAEAKLKGIKSFEIRLNDRNYKIGDKIQYTCPKNTKLNQQLKNKLYTIDYITNYAQQENYIVFTDRLLQNFTVHNKNDCEWFGIRTIQKPCGTCTKNCVYNSKHKLLTERDWLNSLDNTAYAQFWMDKYNNSNFLEFILNLTYWLQTEHKE